MVCVYGIEGGGGVLNEIMFLFFVRWDGLVRLFLERLVLFVEGLEFGDEWGWVLV